MPAKTPAKNNKWKSEITRAICLKCSGRCCTDPDLLVSLDYEKSTRTLHKYKHRWSSSGFHGIHVLEKDASGACVYFDKKTKGCSIYERRPLSCRAWFCGRGTREDGIWQSLMAKARLRSRDITGIFGNLLHAIGGG